jgi:hypothetical protein
VATPARGHLKPLRTHVSLNLASLALELEQHRHFVEGDEG